MEARKNFRVKVEYLSSEGPAFIIHKVYATTQYHAIELAFTELYNIQPNRRMYEVYSKKHSQTKLAMRRCSHTLASYAQCYAFLYS